MSLSPTTYRLMSYRPSVAATPAANTPVASAWSPTVFSILLRAIRDEAADLQKNWHASTPPAFSLPALGQPPLHLLNPGATTTPTSPPRPPSRRLWAAGRPRPAWWPRTLSA